MQLVLSLLAAFGDSKNWQNPHGHPDLAPLKRDFPRIARRWGIGAKVENVNLKLIPLPPVLRQSYGRALDALLLLARGEKDDKVIAELDKALAVHPEGTLRYFQTMIYFGSGRWAEDRESRPGDRGDACRVPDSPASTVDGGFCPGWLPPNNPLPDLKRRAKAAETLAKVIALGPLVAS